MQLTHISSTLLKFSMIGYYFTLICQGIARTQSPTNKNYAPELPTFGAIAKVSPTGVQWKGLALGEPPCRSRYPLCQVSMLFQAPSCPYEPNLASKSWCAVLQQNSHKHKSRVKINKPAEVPFYMYFISYFQTGMFHKYTHYSNKTSKTYTLQLIYCCRWHHQPLSEMTELSFLCNHITKDSINVFQ